MDGLLLGLAIVKAVARERRAEADQHGFGLDGYDTNGTGTSTVSLMTRVLPPCAETGQHRARRAGKTFRIARRFKAA